MKSRCPSSQWQLNGVAFSIEPCRSASWVVKVHLRGRFIWRWVITLVISCRPISTDFESTYIDSITVYSERKGVSSLSSKTTVWTIEACSNATEDNELRKCKRKGGRAWIRRVNRRHIYSRQVVNQASRLFGSDEPLYVKIGYAVEAVEEKEYFDLV